MGLISERTLSNGIYLLESYARVTRIDKSYHERTAYMTVNIYRDKQARIDDLVPVESITLAVYGDEFDLYYGIAELSNPDVNDVMKTYEYAKTTEFFQNAIDD